MTICNSSTLNFHHMSYSHIGLDPLVLHVKNLHAVVCKDEIEHPLQCSSSKVAACGSSSLNNATPLKIPSFNEV